MQDATRDEPADPDRGSHPDATVERRFLESLVPTDIPHLDVTQEALHRQVSAAGGAVTLKQLGDLVPVPAHLPNIAVLTAAIYANSFDFDVLVGPDEVDLNDLSEVLSIFDDDSQRICVVAPLSSMGELHAACRATRVDAIQAYWAAGETVVFSAPELP